MASEETGAPTPTECAAILHDLKDQPMTAADILARFPPPRQKRVQLSLMWLCKYGFIDWL